MSPSKNTDATVTFEWTRYDLPSTAVVTAIADESGEDPAAMKPLYDVVNPDSLNRIFTTPSGGVPQGSVQFEYSDYWVVVKANGRGYIYELDEQPPATDTSLH